MNKTFEVRRGKTQTALKIFHGICNALNLDTSTQQAFSNVLAASREDATLLGVLALRAMHGANADAIVAALSLMNDDFYCNGVKATEADIPSLKVLWGLRRRWLEQTLFAQ